MVVPVGSDVRKPQTQELKETTNTETAPPPAPAEAKPAEDQTAPASTQAPATPRPTVEGAQAAQSRFWFESGAAQRQTQLQSRLASDRIHEDPSAQASTLRTEGLDNKNCLVVATVDARPGDQIVLLDDKDPTQPGHAVVLKPNKSVWDPKTETTYRSLEGYQKRNPQYVEAARVPATDMKRILAAPPGDGPGGRDTLIDDLGLSKVADHLYQKVAADDVGGGGSTTDCRAEIDAYNEKLRKQANGFADEDVSRVMDALQGKSELGTLTPTEQRYLIDQTLTRWEDKDKKSIDRNVDFSSMSLLARKAGSDPNLGQLVATAYADRAVELSSNDDADHHDLAIAASLATDATLWDAKTPQARRDLIEHLGPEKSGRFYAALGLEDPNALHDGGSFAFGSAADGEEKVYAGSLLLEAAGRGQPTAASRSLTDAAFATTGESAYQSGFPGDLREKMANALAHHWYPDDSAKSHAESQRLAGVLDTKQGRQLLANDHLTLGQRLQNLDLVKSHPEWDAKFLKQTDSVYDNKAVTTALAAPTARQYAELRGDAPQALSGTDLDNTVGFALGFPPQGVPANETEAQRNAREQAVANGTFSYYQGEPASKVIDPIVQSIRNVGGPNANVTVLPVQYASKDTGAVQVPLFRVQDQATGRDRFVDNTGRVYQSFDDWKANNQLPPGNMVYPAGGHLSGSDPKLESGNTPRTPDTFGEKVAAVLDDAALVGGVIAGGAILLGSDGILAPLVVGAATAWTTYRSASELIDRSQHGQSISLSDPSSRAAWFGVAAGSLSLLTLGATGVAGRLAEAGSELAFPAATTAAYLRVGTSAVDAATAGNAGYTLFANWNDLSPGQRANLALSAGFWGVSTFAGTKTAGGSPWEPFNANAIRDNIVYGSFEPSVQARLQERVNGTGGLGESDWAQLAVSPYFRHLSPDEQLGLLDNLTLTRPRQPGFDGEETGAVWGTKVEYLDKNERRAYRMEFDNGGRLIKPDGTPYDTTGASNFSGTDKGIFVVSPDGQLYSSTEYPVGEFHHSSFLSGKPVAAAGELEVQNGQIVGISDRSGHYQPEPEMTAQFLRYLEWKGVDLTRVTMHSYVYGDLPASQYLQMFP